MRVTRRSAGAALMGSVAILVPRLLIWGALAERNPAVRIEDAELVAQVEQRVKAWEPGQMERRFDEIGWSVSIREAERLAREHGRPVFLFTHDGGWPRAGAEAARLRCERVRSPTRGSSPC